MGSILGASGFNFSVLGVSWVALGTSLGYEERFRDPWELLGVSWGSVGCLLGVLGGTLGLLGLSWGSLGSLLGPSGNHFGQFLE